MIYALSPNGQYLAVGLREAGPFAKVYIVKLRKKKIKRDDDVSEFDFDTTRPPYEFGFKKEKSITMKKVKRGFSHIRRL